MQKVKETFHEGQKPWTSEVLHFD